MSDDDIELPPLPEWMSNYTIPADGFECDKNVMLVDRMHDYARAAILADRASRELLAERDELAKDAARYRWLRKGAHDDVAVVRGLGAMDYGMSGVAYTYSEEIDGDDLDAAIDAATQRISGGDHGFD